MRKSENPAKKAAAEIFFAALHAVDPSRGVQRHAELVRSIVEGSTITRLILVAFGKAACTMTRALHEILPIDAGVVIVPYGACSSRQFSNKIEVFEAGHPIPDEQGIKATEQVLALLGRADEMCLVVCLISGGGSALLVAPQAGITLQDMQKATDLLLKAGAPIHDLNTVRKHISRVKGGRLAAHTSPARVLSLILSDVLGDDLEVIASGPTAPDPATYADAVAVLEKYSLSDKVPQSIMDILQDGAQGLIAETPKPGNPLFARVENIIIGGNRQALAAAAEQARSHGLHTEVLSAELKGEAREAGRQLAMRARKERSRQEAKPLCLISGGETTVTVKGNGKGGRNMELALAFALEIEGVEGITLLSAGTDGADGPTDAAGAIVDGQTIPRAKAMGLDPEAYLQNNDTYPFFKKIDQLFITGPTGTNVMDVQIVIIE